MVDDRSWVGSNEKGRKEEMMIDQSKEKKQKGTEEIKEIKGRKQNGVLMHT